MCTLVKFNLTQDYVRVKNSRQFKSYLQVTLLPNLTSLTIRSINHHQAYLKEPLKGFPLQQDDLQQFNER